MLTVAAALFASELLGLLPGGALQIAGQSAFRTMASVAVAGCLLIAIGCWEN